MPFMNSSPLNSSSLFLGTAAPALAYVGFTKPPDFEWHLHRAPMPEEEPLDPLPGEEPGPDEEEPPPHPDPSMQIQSEETRRPIQCFGISSMQTRHIQ
jgi:hypothetical protein